MTRAATLQSINCTQCGAGLAVLGGGRVAVQVCGYCGSVLDAQDNYKVLSAIGARDHPDSPVRIGMELTVQGVVFTVIGTIGKIERWAGGVARWVEHQLFSPTHGYAWLTWESGNFTFSRKIRDFPMRNWLTYAQVQAAEKPPVRSYRGQRFRYYETSHSRIDFMEGEFNWLPEIGERSATIVLLGPDAMLGLRVGKTETEVELTRLLPRDAVAREMGLDLSAIPAQRHPLTPYQALRDEGFMRRALGLSAVVALVTGLVFGMISGPRVLDRQGLPLGEVPVSLPFDITNTAQVARLRFDTDVANDWLVVGTRITGPDGALVVEGGRLIQYYFGTDSDGAWTEGGRSTVLLFRPEMPGTHQISFARVEGQGGRFTALRIDEGKATSFWLMLLAVVFGLGWFYLRARRAIHDKRRFAGSDWHEE